MKHVFATLFLLLGLSAAADDCVRISTPKGTLLLTPIDDNAVRVQLQLMPDPVGELVYTTPRSPKFKRLSNGLRMKGMSVSYDESADQLVFSDGDGRVLLSEVPGGRQLTPSAIQGEKTMLAGQRFVSPAGECLFGTGQFQDGVLDVRGLTRRLTQVNTQISIPMVLSNRGYALLWNNNGLTDFNPSTASVELTPVGEDGQEVTVDVTSTTGNKRETRRVNAFAGRFTVPADGQYSILLDVGQRMARKHNLSIDGKLLVDFNNLWLPPTTSMLVSLTKGEHSVLVEGDKNDRPTVGWRLVDGETEFRSPVATGIDYTVFVGTADDCIASYRRVTGGMPMMPRWALGYIHCRERYDTQQELLENANGFRSRGIPVDVIVQDWQWWGKHGWNAMRFDEDKYPDPKAMIDSLHAMDMRLMLSVWSKIDKGCELGRETESKGYYIPGTDWIDFFNPDAADYYWHCSYERLQKPYGIDALWQDATEPENDDLLGRRVNNGRWPGEMVRNVYPLMVNTSVFNGWRRDVPDRRPMILTRCGCPGISRYGVATWSGDVGHDWQTLRRQLVGGLGQMAAGLPWWTFDAGGFFRPGNQYDSREYHEQLIRWVQLGTFLPLMRVHGYMSQTEPWRYGAEVERIMRKYIELRRSLLPYIYSLAARVSRDGYTIMRPLVMDFPADAEALRQDGEFMFGPAFLVAPVLSSATVARVYLPSGCRWHDWWTGREYDGGQYIETPAPLDQIPLFVRAGSIVPMTDGVKVFPGQDAGFTLYEDDGVSMRYEQGEYTLTRYQWNDKKKKLTTNK